MHATDRAATDLTTLRERVAAHDGPGIVVWCLEHGGFRDAADPYSLRWVSPDGTADITVGPERGFDAQVLRLGEAIVATQAREAASSRGVRQHLTAALCGSRRLLCTGFARHAPRWLRNGERDRRGVRGRVRDAVGALCGLSA